MGFRGRIWLDAGVVGVLVAAVGFSVLADVEPPRAVHVAGWCLAFYAGVYAVLALLILVGFGSLDPEIIDRRWWALSMLLGGLTLGAFACVAILVFPVRPDPSWGLLVVVLAPVSWTLGWAGRACDRRAAPDVEGPLYRRRKEDTWDDPYRFVGDRR